MSIVDVTNPAASGDAQMVRVCPSATLPIGNNKFYLLRSYSNSAHEIWDVTNPNAPVGVCTVAGGNPVIGNLAGTHKSWWECDTGIAYIGGRRDTDTAAGWRPGNHIFVFDLKDRSKPHIHPGLSF